MLELKSLLKIKPKSRVLGAKNKKHSYKRAKLDDFTRCKPSRFEYKEKIKKIKRVWAKS